MDKEIIDVSDDFTFEFADDTNYQETAEAYELRLLRLYDEVIKLLERFKQDPEKSTIKWPNRIKDIEAFEKKIKKIFEGS